MSGKNNIAVIVGSIRRASLNMKLAGAIAKIAKGTLNLHVVDLNGLPLYNDDLWEAPPRAVTAFKEELGRADGFLFIAPEHNRSVTAVTKNAVDWGSRPWGQNSWANKPAAIAGTSTSLLGTAVAQSHLRSSLVVLSSVLMGQPELYISFKPGLIDESCEVADPKLRELLAGFVERFSAFVNSF